MAAAFLTKTIALLALLTAAGLALWLAGALPAWGQTIVDYDSDDDGLIEITTLDQIFALYYDFNGDGVPAGNATDIARYNAAYPNRDTATSTRMGCPAGACGGYELMANLDFNSTTSSDFHPFWAIAGSDSAPFNTVLDGNGHTISNVTMANTGADNGFIGYLGGSGVIRNLGLINPTVNAPSNEAAGGLVGKALDGSVISASYIQGGRIRATANGAVAGGLAGATVGSTIRASYSTAQVDMTSGAATVKLGGLVGDMTRGSIIASYAAGPIITTGSGHTTGGLLALIGGIGVTITDSYCDSQATGQASCTWTASPRTTAQLQNPTSYTGIYANWNIDLDGDSAGDYPWNFGTSSQYPTLNTPAQRLAFTRPNDYDANDNGLIDIRTNVQLDAIRYDPDGDGLMLSNTGTYRGAFPGRYTIATTTMGCPNGVCRGYELAADLTFAPGSVWAPVSTFNTVLDGDGHRITGLNVNVGASGGDAGMFGHLGASAVIRDLGLINFHVTSTKSNGAGSNGILAGYVPNAVTIRGVYAQGGGIAVSTDHGGANAGGLVGFCRSGCAITASYSTAAVSFTAGTDANRHAGGLVARCDNCRITASYAAGPVTSTAALSNIGGLTGSVTNAASRITNSYCDTEGTGQSDCDGNAISGVAATGYTTAQLQAPTGYTGIYENWNLNLEGDARADYPWNFGSGSQYPTLNTPAQRDQLRPLNDFDSNDNGLIDIRNLAQLSAMRHDLDGNGDATHADYAAAFEDRPTTTATRMGCPGGVCTGYELMLDLTFPASTSSPHNPWTPIDQYTGVFDGNGHTLTNLNARHGDHAGLFGRLSSGGVIRNVGMINPTVVRTAGSTGGGGGLVGYITTGAQVNSSYVTGGSVAITGSSGGGGGLAGWNNGTIRASYANTAVRTSGTSSNVSLGGLAGRNSPGTIIASYALGRVSATGTGHNLGGLIGRATGAAATVTNSYCDNQTTGQTTCIGSQASGLNLTAAATSTAVLQAPTGYTGIYANWNIDTDGVTGADDPWYFGTSLEYPIPSYAEPTDYDTDEDGLIEIHTLAQFNVIRHDTNGNGDATHAGYIAAFPDRNTNPGGRMGCPLGACVGYELMADIAFDNPNVANWAPIADFNTTLDGNGHTVTGMNVNVNTRAGMFHLLQGSAVVRNLGLVNPTVRASGLGASMGGLAGDTDRGSLIASSYVTGGRLTLANGNMIAGGLVGKHKGTIRASHASTTMRNANPCVSPCNSQQAGSMVGQLNDGEIIASYALGSNQVGGIQSQVGNLVGRFSRDVYPPTVIDSYCSSDVTPLHNCIGATTGVVHINNSVRLTAAELQAPTGYTGIYARWNIGTDSADDATPDDPWYFGASSDYPLPWYQAPANRPTVDYDANNNGLIDVRTLAQLNAMRFDLDGDGAADTSADAASYAGAFPRRATATTTRMGCPSGACAGYELAADLSFATSTDLAPYRPWTPLRNFATTLDGAGHTITGIHVNVTGATARDAALLGNLTASSTVRDLGLLDFEIVNAATAAASNGLLAGFVAAGANITNVYAEGGSITVSASGANGGGLVGRLQGGAVRASYSTAAVTGSSTPSSLFLGGLVGREVGGEIVASYAAGRVSGGGSNATRGGLVGEATSTAVITNSYCDTEATSQTACVGATSSSAMATVAGHDTAAMQSPTDYTGIYRNWNLNQDADDFLEYPWNFGTTTTYPMLNTPAQRAALAPTATDYDVNNNNLIDLSSIAQLHALRWDADGDGDPDAGEGNAYGTAFPGRTATSTGRMGCPETCAGYELTGDLTFPTSTGAYNPWTPVPNLRTTFDGAGHTLTGLTVNTGGDAGLFVELASSGVIQNVGLINPAVTSTAADGGTDTGALVSFNNSGRIDRSYVSGGRVAGATTRVGGLVGSNTLGDIRASYADTTVARIGSAATARIGGLVGTLNNAGITASYAYGPVVATGANLNVGGLVGAVGGVSAEINNSYCNLAASGQTACVGFEAANADVVAPGRTAAQLQAPTGYTGIYLEWNLDLDGDLLPDYIWNFGGSGDYPTFNTAAQSAAAVPAPVDYDANDNNLIDIGSIAQLYALRWDPDGDGDPRAADAGAYGTLFPGRTATATGRMGCPDACAGYELTGPLTFPAETSSDYNPWRPIAEWGGLLDGQGHTLTELRIFTTRGDEGTFTGDTGLFATITRNGVVRDLGLINPAVTSTASGIDTGALVGFLNQGRVDRSYVSGGSVNAVGNRVGGLVGYIFGGQLRASYATAAVGRTGTSSVDIGGLTGVMSNGAEIIASYAAGPVSATGTGLNAIGGLTGSAAGAGTTITNSYCDTGATGQANCVGNVLITTTAVAQGLGAAALRTPTGYTGVYLLWNLDLDGDYNPDYPWNFGGSSDYPVLNTPAQSAAAAPPPMDYDANNNNLIDIRSIDQLNAIRWDPDGDGHPLSNTSTYNNVFPGRTTTTTGRMGCPATCAGYELMAPITFPAATSSPYNPWTPLPEYHAEFNGRGHALTGANINVTTNVNAGLFGELAASSSVHDLGLINFHVTSTSANAQNNGLLAGQVSLGAVITGVYADGGRITISTAGSTGGGLVGHLQGDLRAAWATAAVTGAGASTNLKLGGLAGLRNGGSITAAYAAGPVTSTAAVTDIGGLIGESDGTIGSITNTYCDTEATGQANCIGEVVAGSASVTTAGYTTEQLQTPTGYTTPYHNWNLDLDGDGALDYPWNFGGISQYPKLNTPAQRAGLTPSPMDYDQNNNNLIDISTIAQLDAMRYDPDGDGDPEAANANAYDTIFAGRTATTTGRMGCPDTCAGYELLANLTFPTATTSAYNPWTPIPGFNTEFDGRGRTLTGINVTAGGDTGLFARLLASSTVRDLGLINVNVTSSGSANGTLAGFARGAAITGVYADGGSVTTSGNQAKAGGLVGEQLYGTLRAAWSTAAVTATGAETTLKVGGLVGWRNGGVITASFAAGPVTSTAALTAIGGLVGESASSTGAITDSYCDTTATTQADCIGDNTGSSTTTAAGHPTADLQAPTGYTGIYVQWNLDLDDNTVPDYPWNFGSSSQYPKLNTPTQREDAAPPPMDYDANNNNLIDIRTIAQLNAMRWDLDGDGDPETSPLAYSTAFPGRTATTTGRMGCLSACAGYELAAALTFPTSGAGRLWEPIAGFNTEFDGQGRTITGANINVTTANDAGLFGSLAASSTIRDLGLINVHVTSTSNLRANGALAGSVAAGAVLTAVYADGGRVTVSGGAASGGGLVGQLDGTLRAAWSTAAVTAVGAETTLKVGGLVGLRNGGVITASFAAGPVTSAATLTAIGGLVGESASSTGAINHSYCDTTATTQADCIGDNTGSSATTAAGYTTAALQSPTTYTGIYIQWNLDLDANAAPDYPWNFGSASQYPRLNTPAQRTAAAPPPTDYDVDDNNLIEISNLDQLNALRWDTNGDGDPETSPLAYSTAFPGRITATPGRMGCPDTCAGYELAANLTFPTSTGAYNPWTPIASFDTTLDGKGNTITGANVSVTGNAHGGFIAILASSAAVRDLGLINFNVTSTAGESNGTLAGFVTAGAVITNVYADGGRVAVSAAFADAGGLVGELQGTIQASYATAAVTASGAQTNPLVGGLVGWRNGGSIIASYAAGPVTSAAVLTGIGGLVGDSRGGGAITNSYCDTVTTTQADCIGDEAGANAAPGYTTTQLQTPTGYTGIYRNWNINQDADPALDYPWNFGATNTYPILNTPAQREALIPAPTNYDADGNNLINITTIAQLNALRWDPDGNGNPDPANANAYGTAFPGRAAATSTRMGCPDTCAGYELRANLNFPTGAVALGVVFGAYHPWTPIPRFTAEFNGNGYVIANLLVTHSAAASDAALFGRLTGANAIIRNLGLRSPVISASGAAQHVAPLAGQVTNGATVETSYVAGGSLAVTGAGVRAGGLVATLDQGRIRASYSTIPVGQVGNPANLRLGGLVGHSENSEIIASYAAGALDPGAGGGSDAATGGLVGASSGNSDMVTNSYCDITILLPVMPLTQHCIGATINGSSATTTGHTTAELQQPTRYTGIYENWNLDLDNDPETDDDPWDFGSGTEYPVLTHQRRTPPDSPPPGGPRVAQPPQDTPYNPAADHPEVYENNRYEMAATCNVQRNADGVPQSSLITFDLGNYRGQVILHLAQWNGEYFTSYESLGIAMPTFERDGQTATVRVTTDPTQTRFLLDSISPTTNLVLGYADCHTDDATGILVTPGAAAPTPPETAETPATSTPADAADPAETAATSTPPAPKIYTNDRYEMTASCDVRHNADGEPESSLITFDLGNYQGRVILSLSLWNGEYYASLESHGLTAPTLERNGQTATVLVTTDPTQTRFLLDGTPNGLRTNLLLGYADCHTAGE